MEGMWSMSMQRQGYRSQGDFSFIKPVLYKPKSSLAAARRTNRLNNYFSFLFYVVFASRTVNSGNS